MKLKTTTKTIIATLGSVAAFAVPFLALAQSSVSDGLNSISLVFPNSGAFSAGSTPQQFIVAIIQIMLLFSGMIAVVFVIIGGYRYITSNGNEESAEKGRNTLVNAIIGLVIIILSYVIINVVVNLVSYGTL